MKSIGLITLSSFRRIKAVFGYYAATVVAILVTVTLSLRYALPARGIRSYRGNYTKAAVALMVLGLIKILYDFLVPLLRSSAVQKDRIYIKKMVRRIPLVTVLSDISASIMRIVLLIPALWIGAIPVIICSLAKIKIWMVAKNLFAFVTGPLLQNPIVLSIIEMLLWLTLFTFTLPVLFAFDFPSNNYFRPVLITENSLIVVLRRWKEMVLISFAFMLLNNLLFVILQIPLYFFGIVKSVDLFAMNYMLRRVVLGGSWQPSLCVAATVLVIAAGLLTPFVVSLYEVEVRQNFSRYFWINR